MKVFNNVNQSIKKAFFVFILIIAIYNSLAAQTSIITDSKGYKYEICKNDPSEVRVYTLKNGLKVYLGQNYDEPRIRSIIAVRAGSSFDPADNTGLAHYLEHLLFNGTDSIGSSDWNKEQFYLNEITNLFEKHKTEEKPDFKKLIYHKIDSLSVEASKYSISGEFRKLASSIGGVVLNAYTDYDVTAYWGLYPATSLEKLLKLERERFRYPVLRNFHTELEIVYEEFNIQQDNVSWQKKYAIADKLFPTHPYGQQKLIGSSDHLKNPSIKAIRAYFDRYYVADNMAVILVGDLDFEKTIQLVDREFGNLKPANKPRLVFVPEKEITNPLDVTITGTGPESVYIGFRFKGANSEDRKYTLLTDLMLNNGFAGLFDTELNNKQRVSSAGSTVDVKADYCVHYFDGYPKDGQTLKEVRDLMLQQIDRLKKGDFDEWLMKGVVNDFKKQQIENQSSMINLSASCLDAFKLGISWQQKFSLATELEKITKQEFIDFIKHHYTTNYVVLYRQKADKNTAVKVDKPGISKINLNATANSLYADQFQKIKSAKTSAKFVDYKKEIEQSKVKNGIEFSYVKNRKTKLFELDIIFDMGKNNSKKTALAVEYSNILGTDKYSSTLLKNKYYQYGLSYNASVRNDQIILQIEGIEDNIDKGVELLNHFIEHVVPDTAEYTKFIENVLNQRRNKEAEKTSILKEGLLSYALYGENSPLRNIYSEQELKEIKPEELVNIFKDLKNYKQRIFFYGNNPEKLKGLLEINYKAKPVKEYPAPAIFTKIKSIPNIYFVNYDMVQAEIMLVTRGEKFDAKNVAYSNYFSPYFEQVVSAEIRERTALAYTATGSHLLSAKLNDFDYSYMYAGTQANKLVETLSKMMSFMQNFPRTETEFQYVKADQLKRFEAERIIDSNIFWSAEKWRKRGIDYDIRSDMYSTIQNLTIEDIKKFFTENIASRDISILILGNKKDLDMKGLAQYGHVVELNIKDLFNYK